MNTPQRTESEFKPAELPSGIREIDGKPYMIDAKGGLMPMNMVQAQDQLQDEVVRKIVGYMLAASEQIGRLKQHILGWYYRSDAVPALTDQERKELAAILEEVSAARRG